MTARRLRIPFEGYLSEAERGCSLRRLLLDEWREFVARTSRPARAAALTVFLASACATDSSYRLDHRLEHGIAGAIIDVVTIEAERVVAPEWTHAHPVLAQVVAGLVVGTAAVGKEAIDRSRGPEPLHHSLGDIAFTELGGIAAGIGFTYTWRF